MASKHDMASDAIKLQNILRNISEQTPNANRKIENNKNHNTSSDTNELDILDLINNMFDIDLFKLEYDGPMQKHLKSIIGNVPLTFCNIRNYIRSTKDNIKIHQSILEKINTLSKKLENDENEDSNTDSDSSDNFSKKLLTMLGVKPKAKEKGKHNNTTRNKKKSKVSKNIKLTCKLLKSWITSEQQQVQIASEEIKILRKKISIVAEQKHPELKPWLDKLSTTEILCWATLVKQFKLTPSDNLAREARLCKGKIKGRIASYCMESLQRCESLDRLRNHSLHRARNNNPHQLGKDMDQGLWK